MLTVGLLTVNVETGGLLSPLVAFCQVSQILSCQVKLTTSRQDEEGGPAGLRLAFSLSHHACMHVCEHATT